MDEGRGPRYCRRVSLDLDLETAGVAAVSAAMASGGTSSEALVGAYLERIERLNPLVNAIRCLAPDAEERAAALDGERRDGHVRGPLHGVPVLVKDNIDVAGLPTTAGTLALEQSVPDRDAGLVARLREAGAVVIGKTNLTEMANFMAEDMPSGYSSLGGQVLNPYDLSRTPSGSSSGSGAAAALGLATVTVGTETDGSIISPSNAQSLVGLKPTLRLVPGDGILPIATSQDCAGPMCRTVADAAALLGVLTGETYGEGSGPETLRGVRLAMPPVPDELDDAMAEVYRAAIDVLRDQGAVLVEVDELPAHWELPVLRYEFARDVDAYLARLPERAPIRTMRELAAWNEAHADVALKYGQLQIEKALEVDHEPERAAYDAHRARDLALAGEHGIDATLAIADAAAIVVPGSYGSDVAARAGYPSLVVPAGYAKVGRAPIGLTFLGPSRSEGLLLSLGAAFEEAARARKPVSVVNPSLMRGVAGSPATG
jgi:amidase